MHLCLSHIVNPSNGAAQVQDGTGRVLGQVDRAAVGAQERRHGDTLQEELQVISGTLAVQAARANTQRQRHVMF